MSPQERASRVRLLLFDVDGVLTDATVIISGDGSEAKAFSIRDGAALVWARRAGLTVGLLSGRKSGATSRRAAELGIHLVIQGVASKLAAYEDVLRRTGLGDEAVAYMGDDLLDLPVMARVGLAAAPADAAPEVAARAHWISPAPGGRGAARSLIELVLQAQDRWRPIVEEYDPGTRAAGATDN